MDVTIRHPMASKYQPDASRIAGSAAKDGESGKFARYPAKDNRTITPFAVETWGRLGEYAEDLLQELACEATRHARLRGQAATPSNFLRRWRAAMDACLHKGIVNSLQSARCGLPGRAHRRGDGRN